jgi:hypothetical protein
MSVVHREHLPVPPKGFGYYRSTREVVQDSTLLPYQHLLLRAWKPMNLTAVLTLEGIPTVYVRDEKRPLAPAEAAEVHRQFWNQGVATVLLLRDPEKVCVFSSMTKPVNPSAANKGDIDDRLVETINLAAQASWAEKFYLRLATGQYYSGDNEAKFDPQQAVDAYLIDNLAAVRDELTEGTAGLDPSVAHAFLGRVLFTCYLCDRGIIDLRDYFPNRAWTRLLDLLGPDAGRDPRSDLYGKLFRKLKDEFNGSMFDDDLDSEAELIQPVHLEAIRRFLNGDKVREHQGSLGFWAYDFKFIPVETISAIYEDFLKKEDGEKKHKSGAFHTPRFLAEMTLDLALEGVRPLRGRQYLDPACGSGIFLVLLFNRLAAEWRAAQKSGPSPEAQAKDLCGLLASLRGVDKNLTACRIACFSLYLAFLDQFNPPDVQAYMKATGKKLPSLLQLADAKKEAPALPVVWEGDFLQLAPQWKGLYDIVVGNPPWAGRQRGQIAHDFMNAAPDVLKDSGRACLLLPSKAFLNQTDEFQSQWLRRVTLDKVIQLADYRRILFQKARCACNIARFTNSAPDFASQEIEYVAPKVSRIDLRDGVISVSPQDRKWIPLRLLLHAAEHDMSGVVWKSHLWGTRRDLKFLDFLFTLPRLDKYVDILSETGGKRERRWAAGIGCKPRKADSKRKLDRKLKPLGDWSPQDPFITTGLMKGLAAVPKALCSTLGKHLESHGYMLDKLYSKPPDPLFTPPLVLWNRGFTVAAFFDHEFGPLRFQHALHSVAGPIKDCDNLLFLSAYLRSGLARYFLFHTSASLATERDQVDLTETTRLPFFLPDSEIACPNAAAIIGKVAARIRRLKNEMEASFTGLEERLHPIVFRLQSATDEEERQKWLRRQRKKSRNLQAELDPLIYEYFGLNEQEIALIEVTCGIFGKSHTPPSLEAAKSIPTLQPLNDANLESYAGMLTGTLNDWASGTLHVSASGGVDSDIGLALVELRQTETMEEFRTRCVSKELMNAVHRLQNASIDESNSLAYIRDACLFDGPRIYIVKRALQGQWTRTAALNDAADLYAYIAEARRQTR